MICPCLNDTETGLIWEEISMKVTALAARVAKIWPPLATALLGVSLSVSVAAQDYDVVILNGRVMDPETNLDAVRNVGIKNGRIEKISTELLK